MDFTEADEIAAQRKDPTSHPLRRVLEEPARLKPSMPGETTLILGDGTPWHMTQAFRSMAYELVNRKLAVFTQVHADLWFSSPVTGWLDHASGTIESWEPNGEITFAGGTRLNDKLLVRVTF